MSRVPHGAGAHIEVTSVEHVASVAAQVADVRAALRQDAAATGKDLAAVDAAVDAALAAFGDAHVHAFIGVLIERAVRERLRLPHRADAAEQP